MKTTSKILVALLIWSFIDGILDARLMAGGGTVALLWFYGSLLTIIALIFAWYWVDSKALGYRRPRWLSALMIFLALVAVPLYLYKSRPAGRRGKAMLRCLGYVALVLGASVAGGMVAP